MKRPATLEAVALKVGDVLRRRGVTAVLTGGACAAMHSGGMHQSIDVDFVLQGVVRRQQLDEAMASIGFERHRDRYVHPELEIFVEFPRGPLAIGEDTAIRPRLLTRGAKAVLALSPTDSCRDRLAAFYHWNDRHSLDVAVAIARRRRVDLAKIRRWSESEGAGEKFVEFRVALRSARRR